jgi:RNA-dependent RNA polymerase
MHLVAADRSPYGVHCPPCLELAALASTAVDFAKTGVPAKFPSQHTVREYPHWFEYSNAPSYPSESVLGKVCAHTLCAYTVLLMCSCVGCVLCFVRNCC